MRKKMFTRTLMGAGLALSLLSVAACGGSGGSSAEETTAAGGASSTAAPTSGPQAQKQMPQPDLSGIPEVVAVVNGQEITKDEFVTAYEGRFQQMAMRSQMSGQELDQDQLKQQTAEGLVGTELLIQEAGNRGYSASQEQIDATLAELATANQMKSGDEVIAALKQQGMSEDEVMSQVETQVKVDQLVAEEAGDTQPTEEEVRALYDQMVARQKQSGGQGGGEIPPFEDMKPRLEQQLVAQEEGKATQALVGQLREGADVSVKL